MARRVGTSLVNTCGAGRLALVGLALVGSVASAGCYEHHTADEALLDIPFPEQAYAADAGAKVDAGSKCAGTDAIALFICNLTQPAATPTGMGTGSATQPGIADIIALIGPLLGGTGTGTGTGTGNTANDPLAALTALFGGAGTGTGTRTGTGTATTPSLQDILTMLGLGGTGTGTGTGIGTGTPRPGRDAGGPRMGIPMPTAAQCANPTDQITTFLCAMQQMSTKADAGAPTLVQ